MNCPEVPKPPTVPPQGNHCSWRCCLVSTTDSSMKFSQKTTLFLPSSSQLLFWGRPFLSTSVSISSRLFVPTAISRDDEPTPQAFPTSLATFFKFPFPVLFFPFFGPAYPSSSMLFFSVILGLSELTSSFSIMFILGLSGSTAPLSFNLGSPARPTQEAFSSPLVSDRSPTSWLLVCLRVLRVSFPLLSSYFSALALSHLL